MIVTKIISGLGNQMFQYAAGLALAKRRGVSLRLDTDFYGTQTLRRYELDRLNISAPLISSVDRYRIRLSHPSPGGVLRGAARRIPIGKFELFTDRGCGVDPRFGSLPASTYLDGYWQNEGYFKGISDQIRKEFAFRLPPDAANAAMLETIRAAGHAVSVHVRRGDYVSGTEPLGPCPLKYYEDGLRWMQSRVPAAKYFIFSDDPDWTSANLPVPAGSTFVRHNTGKNDPEDLRLMAACNHFIIANSTFSWWGAWLSTSPGKCVVAPKRWFKEGHGNEEQIVPADWTRL